MTGTSFPLNVETFFSNRIAVQRRPALTIVRLIA
jgi:hypothetical protein